MNVNDIFHSGETLRCEDLQNRAFSLTMKSTESKNFDDGAKLIIRFNETEKVLVSNKTNTFTIAEIYGQETDNWLGQKIELFPTTTMFSGKMVPCIRVRAPQGQQPAPQQNYAGDPNLPAKESENPAAGMDDLDGSRIPF